MGTGNAVSYREDLFRTWVDLERLEQQKQAATHSVPQHFDSTGYVAEKMRRVECVSKALHDSGTLARSMVAKALMGIEISTVWDILIGVCKDVALYYGGSVLTGGVLGGIAGAVPGAMAGASAGAAIGGWILGLLGLRALVQDLIATLPRALQYYQQGIQEAWRSPSENRSCSSPAEGNHGSLSQATFLLANGHVQMVITLLSALMLWISRGRSGRANALQSINQSARLGPRFAQWIETNEEKLHTLLASRTRQGGGGAGRVAESAAAKAAKGKAVPEPARVEQTPLVQRYDAAANSASVVDKSWKLKIEGGAQRTGDDAAHQIRTYREAIKLAKDPDVVNVHLDHGYNRALNLDPKRISPNRRPDVTAIYNDGRVARVEVQSKTDVPAILRSRNAALDAQIRAQGYTPLPPKVVVPTRFPKL